MWVGLVQSIEDLHRTKRLSKRKLLLLDLFELGHQSFPDFHLRLKHDSSWVSAWLASGLGTYRYPMGSVSLENLAKYTNTPIGHGWSATCLNPGVFPCNIIAFFYFNSFHFSLFLFVQASMLVTLLSPNMRSPVKLTGLSALHSFCLECSSLWHYFLQISIQMLHDYEAFPNLPIRNSAHIQFLFYFS